MPCTDFVDARILVDGQPLEEYQDPDNDDNVRYIQAKAGQTFVVQVTFLPGFQLQWAPSLYFEFWIDDDPLRHIVYAFSKSLVHRKGVLTRELRLSHDGKRVKKDNRQWTKALFTFGALGIEPTKDAFSPDKLNSLGKLTIRAFMAKTMQRETPYSNDGAMPVVVDTVPEELMKGRLIKNNIKYTASDEVLDAPEGVFQDFVPVAGDAGTVYTFECKYRNKEILQHLGCIPRSPSPEPDHALIAAHTEQMLKLEKEARRKQNLEILRLRQELEQTRRCGDSRESSTTMVGDDDAVSQENEINVKVEPQQRGVKRERGDDEELQGLMPPPKRPVPMIELDNDDEQDETGPRGTKRPRDEDDDDLQQLAPPQKKMPILVDLTNDD
ncbi:hypothetical protein LTR24_003371 [Lithohypha guttulata]|uniref:DUF7918 domain-containing protein n=1 Tax=Lithohypha guttulata TaxID=1690604 RepID=A0ABR0KFI0_9EURO|nr:hypothetical protein LTR24_003371 [Lithohypha guttulata]